MFAVPVLTISTIKHQNGSYIKSNFAKKTHFSKPSSDSWTCGAMDNASDYGSEDSRFESWQVRSF